MICLPRSHFRVPLPLLLFLLSLSHVRSLAPFAVRSFNVTVYHLFCLHDLSFLCSFFLYIPFFIFFPVCVNTVSLSLWPASLICELTYLFQHRRSVTRLTLQLDRPVCMRFSSPNPSSPLTPSTTPLSLVSILPPRISGCIIGISCMLVFGQ